MNPETGACGPPPMKALDLFCGAGGASMGLHLAGFEVTGVDLARQKRYPFQFHQADALTFPLEGFDFIWASPPCQAFTAYRNRGNVKPAPNLIPAIRERLKASGIAYCIENVPGAPLENPITLCGSMFGLAVRRHRLFETSYPIAGLLPPCNHSRVAIPVYGHGAPSWWREKYQDGYPQAANRENRRKTVEIGVKRIDIATQRIAMGIDWMSRDELTQAIPPAHSEWLARQLLGGIEHGKLDQECNQEARGIAEDGRQEGHDESRHDQAGNSQQGSQEGWRDGPES